MINLLIKSFHLFSLVFICVEILQLTKRDDLYKKIQKENLVLKDTSIYFIFYVLRLLYLPWMFFGLFSDLWVYYLILIGLGISKFLVIYTKKNIFINLYILLETIFSIFFLIVIFRQGLFL